MSINKRLVEVLLGIFLIGIVVLMAFLAAKSRKTDVSIVTNTPGAKFKIVGVTEGTTPANIQLHSGKYKIEVSKTGRKTLAETFSVPLLSNKKISLTYSLEILPNYINPRAGYMDPTQVKESLKNYQERFPFKNALPAQGDGFYIDVPFDNGQINVYVSKFDVEQSKNNAYAWFSQHGVKTPQSLNIKWIPND